MPREREHLEDDLVDVERDLLGRDAEDRDPAAVGHRRDRVAQRRRVARHLHRDVEALDHAELRRGRPASVRSRGSTDDRRAHPRRELAAEGVRLADDDVAGTGVAGDRGRHQPDRPGAADEDVLAEDREGERRVDGVAERVEDRGDLLVDARPVVPDVGHRQGDVLGERAVAPDAEPDRVGAQVPAAGQAVAAPAADDVALAADTRSPRPEVVDVAADLDDLADELVADDERRLDRLRRPRIPRLDVEVRPADARSCGRGSGRR